MAGEAGRQFGEDDRGVAAADRNGEGIERLREQVRMGPVPPLLPAPDDRTLLDPIDRSDLGAVRRSRNLRLPLEALHAHGIFGERGRQDFEGDVAI